MDNPAVKATRALAPAAAPFALSASAEWIYDPSALTLTQDAVVLPPAAKPGSAGSWGTAGNQEVFWSDLPQGTAIIVR